jgi:hypothetical protein
MTVHPDVSGKPQVLLMHERIIEHINRHAGVRWCTFDQIANDFRKRNPNPASAVKKPRDRRGKGANPGRG